MSINNKVGFNNFNKKYIFMNFFKNPKYKSIRVILLLIIVVGAVWFTVSNMHQSNSNQGSVFKPNCNDPYHYSPSLKTCVQCTGYSYWSEGSQSCIQKGLGTGVIQ